ncbi:MAG: phosphate ABC transporter permease PstA, partial [Dokdonella sp.]
MKESVSSVARANDKRRGGGDGQGWISLAAASLSIVLAVVLGLLGLLIVSGLGEFWPKTISDVIVRDGHGIESHTIGQIIAANDERLVLRTGELASFGSAYERIRRSEITAVSEPLDALQLILSDGRRVYARSGQTEEILRAALPATLIETQALNAAGFFTRLGIFARQFVHFVRDMPGPSALTGGVFPALVGTLVLVLLMSVLVMPLGIAAAIYLHEYAGHGRRARFVRSAVNSLAGVPAIVYGVLGLGFLVQTLGSDLDRRFYPERLPTPTFASGSLLWASITLALLTLPVVVVSIEEGLARIPPMLRQGALALGATRSETLWRLLLPAARPALLTALVLALARAAGSVAPLMLVGVVKLAPTLPIDGEFPFLHPTRQFMHLGFSVYDLALASPDALIGVPRAFACALLLIGLVVLLNLAAIITR